MKQIPLTQGLFALVDDEDFEELSKYRWYANKSRKTFYAERNVPLPNGKFKKIGMHRQVLGLSDPKIQADHRNGNGLDNQRENLRACTQLENRRNKAMQCNNSSGFKGVSFDREHGKFTAKIGLSGIVRHLGYFHTAIEAAKAYNAAAIKYHGEFANLNQIPENAV